MGSIAAELIKHRRRPAIWIIGICWTVQIVLFAYVVPYIITQLPTSSTRLTPATHTLLVAKLLPQNLDLTVAASFPLFGGAMMLVLGVFLTGAEYRWGTWSLVLIQGPSRITVLLSKFAASVIIVALVVLASYLAAAAASIGVGLAVHGQLQPPPAGRLALSLLVVLLISSAWTGVGMLLGVLFKGSTAAVAVGLIYALGLENLISSLSSIVSTLAPVRSVLLGVSSGSLVAALGAPTQSASDGTPGVVNLVGGPQATLMLLTYLLFAVVLSVSVMRRRDIA